ncbi:MAG: prepilin-type N-terminal cleavage/methylation domain-containing protein [Gammaproteobacteria bacterium]|jgi:MSHA pilin protein MshA
MRNTERGLSIVEVVMTLVVLAILASTAIPSFVSDRTVARQSAVDGVAGSLGSASAINFTVRSINSEYGIPISNCKDVALTLEGELTSEYTIESVKINPGTNQKCTVTHRGGESAEFVAHGAS